MSKNIKNYNILIIFFFFLKIYNRQFIDRNASPFDSMELLLVSLNLYQPAMIWNGPTYYLSAVNQPIDARAGLSVYKTGARVETLDTRLAPPSPPSLPPPLFFGAGGMDREILKTIWDGPHIYSSQGSSWTGWDGSTSPQPTPVTPLHRPAHSLTVIGWDVQTQGYCLPLVATPLPPWLESYCFVSPTPYISISQFWLHSSQ